jgi:hypothetical protein
MLEISARELFGGIYSFSVLQRYGWRRRQSEEEEKESVKPKFATVIIAC